jgi:mono/diheme cytochrome c family protein
MFMHKIAASASVLCFALVTPLAAQSPNLGQPTTPGVIAPWDISIPPTGTGLPPGSGTAKQGELIYSAQCVSCHGEKGRNPKQPLAGGQGTLVGNQKPVLTVGSYWPYATTLFDYIRRAMPWPAPKSLTDQQIYAVTAYILHLNGIIGENDVIDAQTLPTIQMPNRNGFIRVYPNQP